MKLLKQVSICFFTILTLFPVAQADEVPVGLDKLHISYLRQYMVNHRFFDRVSSHASRSGLPIETQIKIGRDETRENYQWVLREYPLYELMPYAAFTTVVAVAGAIAYANSDAIANYFIALSPAGASFRLTALAVLASLSIIPIIQTFIEANHVIFPPTLPEESLILAYGAKKRLLDKSTQHYIEDELFYSFWRSPGSEALSRLQKILDKALRLPFYSKELVYDEEKIEQILRHYSPDLADRLKLFAHSELIYQQADSTIRDTHYPVYFQGAPGTGKTYAAGQLAEAMGTNLAVVTLDGATIDDIIGTPFETIDAKAGRILDAIIARTQSSQDVNHYNQVLLIDEFDRLFISGNEKTRDVLSFMLKLLDPANRSFYSRYLKTELRLPVTIILAGNLDIHELSVHDPELEAMASRLDKVVFEGFSVEAKKAIATEIMIPNKERRYQSSGKMFAEFTLPESGHEMIDAFIETDQDPGLRSLEKTISKVFEMFAHEIPEPRNPEPVKVQSDSYY
ncbi:ATP-binding protein [Endozoicomonas sp.]|uniref:AAA family ATPase n=1 Tax=Endozoicomonas sp. TaxID=1892382 RepID=UPI002884D031|nr:AAA family ATPase [Endozoicomonas sp.]